jgi:transposase
LSADDELLLSLPGMGPVTAPTVRAFLADGAGFGTANQAASYVGKRRRNHLDQRGDLLSCLQRRTHHSSTAPTLLKRFV